MSDSLLDISFNASIILAEVVLLSKTAFSAESDVFSTEKVINAIFGSTSFVIELFKEI